MCGASALCSVASVVVAAGGATCGHRTLHHSVVSAHSWPQGGKGMPLLMKWPLRVIIITRHTHERHLLLASVLTNLGPSVPFFENTKKATKNPTARPTKGTRRATVPPKPPLKAHMHIVTHLVHLQPRAIIHQIVRQCTWEFRLPTSRDEKKRRYPEMNQSSDVRARRGSV